MKLVILDELDPLLARPESWDDLWQRSEVALPTARAALVGQWIDQFAPGAPFRAVTVEHEGRLLAALPLVGQSLGGVCTVGTLPSNDWIVSGELLLDPSADAEVVGDLLVQGLQQLPWPLVWLRLTRTDRRGWHVLKAACTRAGLGMFNHPQHEVGLIELPADFAAYEASWSGNHRRHMGKAQRRLEREGGAELQVYTALAPDEVEPLLAAGFALEDRSWKGKGGTSVLATPGMLEFFVRQAKQLAAWGQLQLVFVMHQGRPIAFEYGWLAKGTYFTPKVAFDPEFSQFTPSQVLRYRLYKQWSAAGEPPVVDFMGPLADATSKWITGRYEVGATLIAMPGVVGRTMLGAFRLARATRSRLRSKTAV
jgi:CelD/BcsL family acetyltransferase involved in cellulose biosynthesis